MSTDFICECDGEIHNFKNCGKPATFKCPGCGGYHCYLCHSYGTPYSAMLVSMYHDAHAFKINRVFAKYQLMQMGKKAGEVIK